MSPRKSVFPIAAISIVMLFGGSGAAQGQLLPVTSNGKPGRLELPKRLHLQAAHRRPHHRPVRRFLLRLGGVERN